MPSSPDEELSATVQDMAHDHGRSFDPHPSDGSIGSHPQALSDSIRVATRTSARDGPLWSYRPHGDELGFRSSSSMAFLNEAATGLPFEAMITNVTKRPVKLVGVRLHSMWTRLRPPSRGWMVACT
jgi:hypothetical protein